MAEGDARVRFVDEGGARLDEGGGRVLGVVCCVCRVEEGREEDCGAERVDDVDLVVTEESEEVEVEREAGVVVVLVVVGLVAAGAADFAATLTAGFLGGYIP